MTLISTSGSMPIEVMWLAILERLYKSMVFIWKCCHVWILHHTFFSWWFSVLIGIPTSPFTWRFFSFAPLVQSVHTSRDFTSWMLRVILTQWITSSGPISLSGILESHDCPVEVARCPDWHVPQQKGKVASQEMASASSPQRTDTSSLTINFLMVDESILK